MLPLNLTKILTNVATLHSFQYQMAVFSFSILLEDG